MLATRRILHIAVPCLLAGILGCVVPEVHEVRYSRESSTSEWTATETLWNLGTVGREQGEFDSLLAEVKSTRYLEDSTEGRLVERVFWEEGDSLCERVTALTRTLPDFFHFSADSTNIYHDDADSLGQILATNGTVTAEDDEVVIRWPADTKEIYLKWRLDLDLTPFTKEERAQLVEASKANPIPKTRPVD